jgi:hypothetical protein
MGSKNQSAGRKKIPKEIRLSQKDFRRKSVFQKTTGLPDGNPGTRDATLLRRNIVSKSRNATARLARSGR